MVVISHWLQLPGDHKLLLGWLPYCAVEHDIFLTSKCHKKTTARTLCPSLKKALAHHFHHGPKSMGDSSCTGCHFWTPKYCLQRQRWGVISVLRRNQMHTGELFRLLSEVEAQPLNPFSPQLLLVHVKTPKPNFSRLTQPTLRSPLSPHW